MDGVISLTVCGAADADAAPGSLVVFDDPYFPSNRLPDGSPCTWFTAPGEPAEGHWIFDRPFSEPLRRALLAGAEGLGVPVLAGGVYGHVDGPRFNTRSEIAALAAAGVTAVSQTAGPKSSWRGGGTPAGPRRLRHRLRQRRGPRTGAVEALLERMAASKGVFAELVGRAVSGLEAVEPAGFVYRFGS